MKQQILRKWSILVLTRCFFNVWCKRNILEAKETVENDCRYADHQNFGSRVKLQMWNSSILEYKLNGHCKNSAGRFACDDQVNDCGCKLTYGCRQNLPQSMITCGLLL